MATTNVPGLTFGPLGITAPSTADVQSGVEADYSAAFGGGLDLDPTTPEGQLIVSTTAIIDDSNEQFINLQNLMDPAYTYGRFQDGIARIYFLTRNPAQPTVVQCTLTGLAGVAIPIGAIAADTAGNLYTATSAGTIGSGGTVSLPFACSLTGPVSCPAGTLTIIYQAIPGWDAITNPADGVLGNNVETRQEFEARRAASVALNARGTVQAVQANVLAVPGVLDSYVIENDVGSPVTVGGYTLAANSIYVAVVGGNSQSIANAIWAKKPPGCAYNGNTTETVVDDNSGYEEPYPSYQVTFEIPSDLEIYFAVSLVNSALVPSNYQTLVQAAIVSAFAGGDGGPRARIGSLVLASRFYSTVMALGAWVQIRSIFIGTSASPSGTSVQVQINQAPVTVAGNIVVSAS